MRTLVIGKLGGPKGLAGDIKVISYSGESHHFSALHKVDLRWPAHRLGPDTAAVPKTLKVIRVNSSDSNLTIAFEGFDTPESARLLTGAELLVEEKEAAPLHAGEWYVKDLIGLDLVDGARALGKVVAVIDDGPWIEAAVEDGSRHLIPFHSEFIGAIDMDKKSIELLAPWILEE